MLRGVVLDRGIEKQKNRRDDREVRGPPLFQVIKIRHAPRLRDSPDDKPEAI